MARRLVRSGKELRTFGADDGEATHTPSAWMISLVSSLALGQILFFVWVTLSEHKWVILAERRGAPNAAVIDAVNGSVLGTIDLGGEPEQAATDRKGRVYVDVRDKSDIAVIDARALTVAARYSVARKGGRCSGLAIDEILFAGCRAPQMMINPQCHRWKDPG
jgi:DNA-binding beta-propeller fold protein YncE